MLQLSLLGDALGCTIRVGPSTCGPESKENRMTETAIRSLPALSAWKAQVLRLTVFPSAELGLDQNWWEELVGEPPENRNVEPRRNRRTDSGPYRAGTLTLKIESAAATRVDWLYAAKVDIENIEETEIPALGSLPEPVDDFRSLLGRWLDHCPALVRIAFGAVLVLPTDSTAMSYALLNALLAHVDVDQDTSDFMYRINRPQPSKVIACTLNRLSSWSALRIQNLSGELAAGSIPAMKQVGADKHAVRVELDINTKHAPDFELAETDLPSVFNELTELAIEIAKEGDRK
jgi:hypothetical protein